MDLLNPIGIAIFVVLFSFFIYTKRAKHLEGVRPAPGSIPFFGHLFHLRSTFGTKKFLQDTVDAALVAPKEHYSLSIPDKPCAIRLCTEESVRHVLKDAFDKYLKVDTPFQKSMLTELFGDGIFANDGDRWKFERKVASHMFSTKVLHESMETTFLEHGEDLDGKLRKAAIEKQTIDIQDILKRFTMDSICKIAFGVDFGNMNSDSNFCVAFDRVQELLISRFLTPPIVLKTMMFFKIGPEAEYARHISTINQTVESILHDRQKTLKEKDGEQSQKVWKDLVSQFIMMAKTRNESMDSKHIRDVVMNFIIAGRDTTACLLTWTFYELHHHPEMEKKILEELEKELDGSPPNYESVNQLKYMKAFLSEVLRLHPPVPFDSKRAIQDDVLPDGTKIPAGTQAMYSPYLFGRLDYMWENPLELRPERWFEDPNPSEYKFITFNAGPRICLGKRMAYLEAQMVLSLVLPKFRLELVPEQTDEIAPSLILWVRNGLRVTVHER